MRALPRCSSRWRPREVRRLVLAALLAACTGLAAQPADDAFVHLEDAADARTQEFLAAQGRRAREALDRIPGRADLLGRIRALTSAAGPMVAQVALGGSRVFYLRSDAGTAATSLFMREDIAGGERLLIDARREAGAGAVIDWIVPSP